MEFKKNNTLQIQNEKELHYAVVSYIRKEYPDCLIIPTLGDLGRLGDNVRCEMFSRGYCAGSPDLLIINNGEMLFIEFKSPTGKGLLSEQQEKYFEKFSK